MLKRIFIILSVIFITFSCNNNEAGEIRESIQLSDDWNFVVDSLDKGDTKKWYANYPGSLSVPLSVPHTWNVMSGLESYVGTCWYKKNFNVSFAKGQRIYLYFEAVYRDAEIFFNGCKVGENFNSGYLPFKVEITDQVKEKNNQLVVKVSNEFSKTALPYMKSFDWANDGGIIRPVSLIKTGGNFIDFLKLDTRTDGNVKFCIKLDEKLKDDASLLLSISDMDNNQVLNKTYRLPSGKKEYLDSFYIDNPELWHFDNPCLYKSKWILKAGAKGIDSKLVRFGVREIEVIKDSLYLNGESIRVCGIEWMPGSSPLYGMAEPDAYVDSILNDLKDINCVLTRFHWPQSDYVLSKMDEMGFLVQEEIPWWQQPGKSSYDDTIHVTHVKQITDMIQNHSKHPSIISWGIGNEIWGQSENVKQIFKELKSYAKSLDTTRIVTFVSNSISYGPKADVSALSDILTWNEYIGTWHGKHRDELNSYMDQIREELPSRSMMITEHGLCEPVFTGGDVRRIDEMLFHFKEWEKRSWISGVIYFSLNDYRTHMGESNEGKFRQRVHGVTDLYRQRKPSFDVYKKLSSPVSVSEEHLSDKEIKLIIGCKKSLPAYTISNYKVETIYENDTVIFDILDLKPGENFELELDSVPISYRIIRPNGYVCFEN